MAKFDLGKKITFASNSLSQKARNVSEVSGLKGQINAEQTKINNYFQSLGKQYYDHADEYQIPELKELVDLIKESEQKIDSINRRIFELENARVCPNCGIQIQEGTIYCIGCGVRLDDYMTQSRSKESAPPARHCVACGAVIPDFAVFCTKCGTKQ